MNQEDELVIERLREWLSETRSAADAVRDLQAAPSEFTARTEPKFGLYEFAAEFTALRQELKLQTKSTRGLQEQSEQALDALRAATRQLQIAEQQARETVAGASSDSLKPFAEALINLDEALQRGRQAIEAARQQNVQGAIGDFERQLDESYQHQSLLARWFSRNLWQSARSLHRQQIESGHGRLFDSILTGYQVIQGRLEKVLKEQGIERINCLQQPLDPHCMTVVEARAGSGQPPGQVVEEIRRGYKWKGKILRYAEVGVATGSVG